ncbi:MAG: zinc ribbon domain-containing protein [Chloroflexi bacterium]|nr:zinc ribbon domain-containing protein [Chloroflexota bacterium]
MLVFAPQITQLIDVTDELLGGGGDIRAFEDALAKAREFDKSEKNRFNIYIDSRPKRIEIQNLGIAIEEGFQQRKKGLVTLRRYLENENPECLANGIDDVIKGSIAVAGNSINLKVVDDKCRFSNIPLLDDVIKACMNIYQKNARPALIRVLMPELVQFVFEMEADLKEFTVLFPAEREIIDVYNNTIRLVKNSVGAFNVYLEEGNREDLYIGGQMLFVGGHEFIKVLKKIGQVFKKEWVGSEVPYVEKINFAFRAYKEGFIKLEALEKLLEGIRKVHKAFYMSLEKLEASPLSPEFKRKLFPGIRKKLAKQDEILSKLLYNPEMLNEYKAISIGLKNDFQAIKNELKITMGGLQKATDYENMRNLIFGVQQGRIPLRYFRQILNDFEDRLLYLIENETSEIVLNALDTQREGLEELKLYPEDRNKEHLMEGWRLIDSGVKAIIGMLPQQKGDVMETKTVFCIKCGAPNIAEVQHCINCGAFIPFAKLIASDQEHFSVKEGEPGRPKGSMGQNLMILQELVQRLENRQASIPEMEAVVGSLLKQAQDTRKIFEKMLPALKTEKEKENCTDFIASVREFEEGLERMLTFSVQRNFSNLVEGLSKASNAADKLVKFVQR